ILRTNDGGANWAVQISGVPSNLLGVKAVNAKQAWAVGLNGVILSTENGGRRWQRDAGNTTSPLRAVTFHDNDGWAVGRDGVILRYAGKGVGELRTILGNK
ncbi:MAG TPA: YCF48-related protein, partial [Blastocatellia bacterium]|nr:YCF48-related protein [Blastocatellia bacterium]